MYANLKLQIWKTGIRQNRLARELKIHETVLSKIINGSRKPSLRLRALLAEYLQKDEAWLFRSPKNDGRRNGGSPKKERRVS